MPKRRLRRSARPWDIDATRSARPPSEPGCCARSCWPASNSPTLDPAHSLSEKAAMSLLVKIALGALCAYALIGLAAYFGQRRLMYFPDRARTLPAQAGLPGVEERVLNTPDGARLIAWYGKARPGAPTILYFHGNAGSLAARAPRLERFMAQGSGVYT